MELRMLRAEPLERLRQEVPENLEKYRYGDSFSYLLTDPQLSFSMQLDVDLEPLRTLDGSNTVKSEVENCLIVYQLLSQLTPYDARDERLWAYLCHTFGMAYSRARWPIPDDDDKAVEHVRTHFFAGSDRGIERDNALSRLWWLGHMASRVQSMQLREALEVFLYRSDARAQIVERPTLSQNAIIFEAVLSTLAEHVGVEGGLLEREHNRRFMRRLNAMGGYVLLDVLPLPEAKTLVSSVADSITSPTC